MVQAVKSSAKIESILKMGDEGNPDHCAVLLPKRTVEMLEDWLCSPNSKEEGVEVPDSSYTEIVFGLGFSVYIQS